jgi:hypothetical protein
MKTTLLTTAALLLFSGAALAHPGGHHPVPQPPPEEAPATDAIPADYAGVITAMGEQHTALTTALQTDKIVDLHNGCQRITDLAGAIEKRASALPEAARTTAAKTAEHLVEQVELLANSATAGKKADAKAALSAIRTDVDALDSLDAVD